LERIIERKGGVVFSLVYECAGKELERERERERGKRHTCQNLRT
jgi:hypothetical protein